MCCISFFIDVNTYPSGDIWLYWTDASACLVTYAQSSVYCSPTGYIVHRHWGWLVIIWRSLGYVKDMVWILGFGVLAIGLIGLTYLWLLKNWSRLWTAMHYLFQINMTLYGDDLLIGYCCKCIEPTWCIAYWLICNWFNCNIPSEPTYTFGLRFWYICKISFVRWEAEK